MRARQATRLVVFPLIALLAAPAEGQAPVSKKPPAAARPAPMPILAPPPTPRASATAAIPPATPADAKRAESGTQARISELKASEAKERPGTKAILEVLEARLKLLADWGEANKEREAAEHPKVSPEGELAEDRAELEKVKALLDQSAKAPDPLLPGAFQAASAAGGKSAEGRLVEMKEAIESARADLRDRGDELEKLRAEGTRTVGLEVATLRAARDKAFQACAAQAARRGEREAAVLGASAPEGRELAREKLANDDWECRVESARLAAAEARVAQATKRIDVGSAKAELIAARVRLARRLIERMEALYAATAERQRTELQKAGAEEQARAARANDPLEKYRARRTAELLDLESQVVAYDKSGATTSGLSLADQTAMADRAIADFEELQKLLNDGEVSPLDVLRLKNDFRRIIPERDQITRTDLAASNEELITDENALTDAEIDLVNDSRDDRFERESLLEQVPASRRGEAKAMLDDLEARRRSLLFRRREALTKLARRAEETHAQIMRRLGTLDKHYAFIRTHIFWVRDAEPIGPATFAHARDDAGRAVKGLVKLGLEPWDRSLWGRPNLEFTLIVAALVLVPLPLHLARRALDRRRLATGSEPGLGLADVR